MLVATSNVFYRPFMFVLAFFYSAMTSWANGAITATMMRMFGASDWLFAASASAICLPLYLFSIFIIVDIIEYLESSSARNPPWTMFALGLLWLCISIPTSFAGAHQGFK